MPRNILVKFVAFEVVGIIVKCITSYAANCVHMLTGGFDGTSNALAGKMFNIPIKGTQAHSYISSYTCLDELKTRTIKHKQTGTLLLTITIFCLQFNIISISSTYVCEGIAADLLELAVGHRKALAAVLHVSTDVANEGELAAMVSFAIAIPNGFMALVDTYDVKRYFL